MWSCLEALQRPQVTVHDTAHDTFCFFSSLGQPRCRSRQGMESYRARGSLITVCCWMLTLDATAAGPCSVLLVAKHVA